jgi:uncharacterized protein
MPINKSEKLLLITHISDKCNFQCSYCYSSKSKKDMPEKVMGAITEFANSLVRDKFCSGIVLALEGGEPTLDKARFKKFVKYAQKAGVKEFVLCTNGSNLDKEMVDYLAANKIYPVISFESKKSFVKNRASHNLRIAEEMWNKIDSSLAFFVPFLAFYNKDKLDSFDVIRGRITITPSTIGYLADSVRYLYESSIGAKILITLMPAMSKELDKEWRALASDKKSVAILENEFKKIAELYLWGLENKKPLNFCVNECLSLNFTNLASGEGLKQVPFCGAGNNLIGIDMKGALYPCYLLSAAKTSAFRERFKIGSVFRGFNGNRTKAINEFCGKKQNKQFSCLYWNWFASGSPDKPAAAYKLLFNAWEKAALRVRKELKEKPAKPAAR